MQRLFIFLLLIPLICIATTIYTKKDNNGNTTYSDIPFENSTPTVVPEVNSTISSPKNTATPSSTTSGNKTNESNATTPSEATETIKKPYTLFAIHSPKDQDTFQNQRSIPVNLDIQPELQKGDSIQLYVDGSPYGARQDTPQLQIEQLDRGTHTVYAVLISNSQIVKQTNTITIFIHYASLGGSGG